MVRDRPTGGSFDATDLVVGLVLTVLIPIVFTVLLTVFGVPVTRGSSGEVVDRTERIPVVAKSPEYMRDLFIVSSNVLEESARFYLDKWRSESDGTARIFLARWARQSLEKSSDGLSEFLAEYEASPELYTGLANLVGQARARLDTIRGFLDELQKENYLDLDY